MLSGIHAVVAAGDTSASVTVWLLVVGLVAVGVLSVLTAVWMWRGTRVDSPALAVLEEMSRRRAGDIPDERDAVRDARNSEIHGSSDAGDTGSGESDNGDPGDVVHPPA